MTWDSRRVAVGGVLGPVAFIAAWLSGALLTDAEYSSVNDAISRLAAVGADTRPLMTAGFVVFGFGLAGYAAALHRNLDSPAWGAALATGVATLGVAATPLDRSDTVDQLHGVFAVAGYITLAAIPLLAYPALRRGGHGALAAFGVLAAVVTSVALALSATGLPSGALQRLGLSATDLWVIVSAGMMLGSPTMATRCDVIPRS